MRKKEDRKDIYWERLSFRLQQERNNLDLTQQQLAEKAEVSREKLNYAELNITGRTLQINELARISKTLNISMDYLVGLTDNKNITSYNGLSDEANEVISKLDKSSLEMYGIIAEEYNNSHIIEDLKMYRIISKIISQINSNLMKSTKSKVINKDRVPNPDVQKFAFIFSYIMKFRTQTLGYPEYVKVLWEKYETIIQNAINACGNLLNYNEDRDLKVDFESIKSVVEPLTKFKDYIRYNLEHKITSSIDNIIKQDIEEDKSYNKLKQYANEISIQESKKMKKDKS